jgi:RNA polymerase subunit RPABC4/transcription elongation factor Spt4
LAASSEGKGTDGRGGAARDVVLRAGSRPYVDLDFEGNAHFSCSRCGRLLEAGLVFCPGCRTGIGWVLPSGDEYRCGGCGEPLESEWRFCPSCTCEIDWG